MVEVNDSELKTLRVEGIKNIFSGNYKEATEIYQHILIRYSDNMFAVADANFHLGDIFVGLEKYELAEKYALRAINLNPAEPLYRFCLGTIYANQRRWNEAISELEIAHAGLPNDSDVVRMLGSAFIGSGNTEKGLYFLEEAVRMSPDNPISLIETAIAYFLSGRSYKAIAYALRAEHLNPNNLTIQTVLKTMLGSTRD